MATTRDRILRAARELFADQGYARTSIRQVADRAGANSALIYYYFGNKADLFEASMGEPSHQLRAMLERALAAPPPASHRLELFLREYVPFALTQIPLTALVFRSLSSGDPELAERMRAQLEPNAALLRRIIQQGVEQGEFRPLDAHLAVGSLLGMVLFFVLAAPIAAPALEVEPGPDFADRLAAHTLDLFLQGVRAPAGGG